MNQHISDDLPRLLTGDADRAETLAAAEHLRTCLDCQQELVSAVVAHAALSSARRVAAPRVAAPVEAYVEPTAAALPDMSAVFARVRDEAARTGHSSKRRRALIAVAAAAVVATAGGITIAETVGSSSSTHQDAQTVLLQLRNPQTGGPARVTVTGDRMHLDATSLPKLDSAHQYEVWLVDATRLRPLGYVGGDRTADLIVPASVMSQYNSVAISVQGNQQVQFSGDVVARGSYG
jgi:anti-sigma-K factor RskA